MDISTWLVSSLRLKPRDTSSPQVLTEQLGQWHMETFKIKSGRLNQEGKPNTAEKLSC
jgi:hypothetical protein